MERNVLVDTAIFILRIAVGAIFLVHGMQKVFGAFGGGGIEGTTQMVSSMGFSPVLFWVWALLIAEFLGGLFLILGVLPRISALSIAIVMLVAIVKVHVPKGFFTMQGGFEYPLLVLASCISIMLAGGGRFSLYNKL